MAKKRQSIRDIQDALKANTQYICPEEEATPTPAPALTVEVASPKTPASPQLPADAFCVGEERAENIRLLAAYQNTTPEALIQLAIDDLLDLRRRQLEAAREGKA